MAVTLIGLTAVTAGLLGMGYWAAERWVENRSMEDLLERELERRTGAPLAAGDDGGLRYYRAASDRPPPAALAALPPGRYRRLIVGGRAYQGLVRQLGPGDNAILLYDVSLLEVREQRLLLLLAAGLVASGLTAWRASRTLAVYVLAPLGTLVAAIGALDPARRGSRLALPDPADQADLRVIVQALNGYMERLDALVERERVFAAAASHELRSPLAVIAGAAEILEDLPAAQAPVQRIARAVHQARLDLNALLALSRGESEAVEVLRLDRLLPQWAQEQLASIAGAAPQLHWQLAPEPVTAPPGSLHVIFVNLLRNALRAAGAGGCVSVAAGRGRLTVEDSGAGIPAAELPHLFEPHFRGSGGGTGIGLYVARTLALRQGWELSLRNGAAGGGCAELRMGNAV
ncbi:MAG: HAMP domain-containing histidine kinase [Nevskia sp.]|nr:HAMP domain-containing histidine kinase [Nevskia sp.]